MTLILIWVGSTVSRMLQGGAMRAGVEIMVHAMPVAAHVLMSVGIELYYLFWQASPARRLSLRGIT
jgi:hypothetical protein